MRNSIRFTALAWCGGAAIVAFGLMALATYAQAPAPAPAPAPLTFYVAPNGNDSWSGTLEAPNATGTDGPFATVGAAQKALQAKKAAGALTEPAQVLLRGGTYAITEPLRFKAEDSGTAAAPITYAAFAGEQPILSGGRRIQGWKQAGNVWQAQLPEVASGAWRFSALWVNGAYRAPARTPNAGEYYHTAGTVAPAADADEAAKNLCKRQFRFNGTDIEAWPDVADAIVVVMHAWDTSHQRIEAVDAANRIVTFTQAPGWDFEHFGAEQRYYVENVAAALDAPGEWYLDRKSGVLSYWPMPGEDMATAEVVAPVAAQLLVLEGDLKGGAYVDWLTFKGLSFQHTEFTIGPNGQNNAQAAYPVQAAIQANGARWCAIEACEIGRISTYAVWLQFGCRDNRVVRNHIHQLGAGGVRIGDGSNPADDNAITARNVVDDNWIHDGGLIFPAAVGAWIGRASYNTISHNEISDFYYTGVSVGWSWGYDASSANHNIVEYNHIHDLGKGVLSDMGGIYTLGISPGTCLRHNLIHDVHSFSYGGWGIYPDEGSTDMLIEDNVVYNTKTGGFHQHYGRGNHVRNNIFAFSQEGQLIRTREEGHLSFFFERNIVYFTNGKLLGSNWGKPAFEMDYNCYFDPAHPDFDFAGRTFADWRAQGKDAHSIVADPLFENPDAHDFRLKPDSPALALGFVPIDISQVGPYACPAWIARAK